MRVWHLMARLMRSKSSAGPVQLFIYSDLVTCLLGWKLSLLYLVNYEKDSIWITEMLWSCQQTLIKNWRRCLFNQVLTVLNVLNDERPEKWDFLQIESPWVVYVPGMMLVWGTWEKEKFSRWKEAACIPRIVKLYHSQYLLLCCTEMELNCFS